MSTKKYDGDETSLRIFVGPMAKLGDPSLLTELPILQAVSWCNGSRYEIHTPRGVLIVNTCGSEPPTSWEGQSLTVLRPDMVDIREEKGRAIITPRK